MSLDLDTGTLTNKGRFVAEWTRCSCLPQFGEVPSANRAFQTRYFGELHKQLGHDASTGVRNSALKSTILDPDQFLYLLSTVFILVTAFMDFSFQAVSFRLGQQLLCISSSTHGGHSDAAHRASRMAGWPDKKG